MQSRDLDENWLADIATPPFQIEIHLDRADVPRWVIAKLRHRRGWILAAEACLETPFGLEKRTILTGVTDHGEVLLPAAIASLLDMPVSNLGEAEILPPAELARLRDAHYWDFLGSTNLESLRRLDAEELTVAAELEALRMRFAAFEAKIDEARNNLSLERRRPDTLPNHRTLIDRQRAQLEEMSVELETGRQEKAAAIRVRIDGLEARVMQSLRDHGTIEPLWALRWCAVNVRGHVAVRTRAEQWHEFSRSGWTVATPIDDWR